MKIIQKTRSTGWKCTDYEVEGARPS